MMLVICSSPSQLLLHCTSLDLVCVCAAVEMDGRIVVMGFEGSANKIGVGIVLDDGTILANVRHTYVRHCLM
jgi:hypothetical protein